MADFTGPPLVSFSGGMFSGRVDSEYRESAQATYYQLQSVDFGPTGTGATITSGQTAQATGYQVQAAITGFTTVTPGVTGNGNTPTAAAVLPQTSRPEPFSGLLLYVGNTGANPINLYPHPNDPSNSINGQAANTPVILGVNTITALQCYTPGVWQADGIGEGFAGSIATIVSQGTIASAGSTNATATQITQAMVNIAAAGGASQGVALPKANAGLQIVVNFPQTGSTPIIVYPLNGSGDTINGVGSLSVAIPQATPAPIVFFCFNTGSWFTK